MTDRSPQRTRARRRAATATSAVAISGLVITYLAYALLAPLPAVSATLNPIPTTSTAEATVSLPGYGASAIGAVDDTQIFAASDLDTPRPIASITKVITALVVLDSRPIAASETGELLTLTAADARLRDRYVAMGGSVASAPIGLIISQRQVIELMMVTSANNYAESLAVWAFGSVDAYLLEARRWLDSRGLTTITVADTTGFSPGNTASPRALLALGRIALDDPIVSSAAALPEVTVAGVGTYPNRNRIIGVDGVTGLKTGTLDEAGACLLFTASHEINGETIAVVGVVLGGPDHRQLAADVRTLLSSIRDDYHAIQVITEGQLVATYDAPWGEQVRLDAAESVETLVWGHVNARSSFTAPPLYVGIDSASPPLTVRVAGETVHIALEFDGRFEGPDLAWRISQPIAELLNR